MVQVEAANFKEDGEKIFSLVNEAYKVETGSTGVAFKNCPRLLDPTQMEYLSHYEAGHVLMIKDTDGQIQAVLFYELEYEKSSVYFGPFSVRKDCTGKGYGRLLIKTMEECAQRAGIEWTRLVVVNHRTELLSMYTYMGFELLDGEVPYNPGPGILTRPSHFLEMRRKIQGA
jgi:GNAT superfamily N-acetyltransferase